MNRQLNGTKRDPQYEPIIGLEVHAQLLTRSKMFCRCAASFGDRPNTNICPVCTGQPGALPVLNRHAVELAIRLGLAVGSRINERSIFARKNYFYPDLPKGYQISQYEYPICEGGGLEIELNGKRKRINLVRIHMEEDAGKLLHDYGCPEKSHVDYNRAGIPLIEIVSGPDIRSAAEAVIYLKELRSILMYLDICDGNMQEGSFRCDANISLRPFGGSGFGTRTELKNLNSFRALERALNYEIERQSKILKEGGTVEQETLLWDEVLQKTSSMRGKEEAHDYRYFPDPDLLPLVIDKSWVKRIKRELPELKSEKMSRFVKEYGIPEYDAKILTEEKPLANFYEEAVKAYNSPKKISNWIMTELLRELKNDEKEVTDSKVGPQQLASLVKLIDEGTISGKIAKTVFEEMYKTGRDPSLIIKEKGLKLVSDTDVIEDIVDKVIGAYPKEVSKYRAGKTGILGFFVGQVMKEMHGQADPKIVNELLKKKLG